MKSIKLIIKMIGVLLLMLFIFIGISLIYFKSDPTINDTIEFDSKLPKIKVNDEFLHGEIHGIKNNNLIIVVHGGPGGDYRSLLPLNFLSDKYKIIFFDQRGSGLSKRYNESELNIGNTIDDIKELIKIYSNNGKAILIGHSFGGFIISQFTSKYPQMVDSLILIESAPLTYNAYNSINNSISITQIPSMLKSGIRSFYLKSSYDKHAKQDFFMTDLMSNSIKGYWCNDEIPESIKLWRFGTLAYNKNNSDYINYLMNDKNNLNLRNFPGKVLIVFGNCSVKYGSGMQNLNKNIFLDPILIEIPKSGHIPISENPDYTLDKIRNYLK